MQKSLHCIVKGRVQMVMFRDFTQRKGSGLGLTGTVQNLKDGSVEVFAYGEEGQLIKLLEKLHKGSLLSRVDSVEAIWGDTPSQFPKFTIVY